MNRNIDACKQLSMMTRSALGPHGKSHHNMIHPKGAFQIYKDNQYGALLPFLNLLIRFLSLGMNKMVINHLEKLFITSDAATIIKETDVHHPAAKMIA